MTLVNYSLNLAAFVITCISGQFWTDIPNLGFILILFVLFTCFYRSAFTKWSSGILMAILVYSLHAQLYLNKVERLFHAGENITINGSVNSIFKQITHGFEYSFTITHINQQKLRYYDRPQVRLIVPEDSLLLFGEQWQAEVKLKAVYGRLNEAGFDKERYFASQGWAATAVVTGELRKLGGAPSFRYRLYQKVDQLSFELSNRSIIKALSFGVRHDISPQHWDSLKQSGLSHLIAISGLHIGIAFMLGWGIGWLLRLVFPSQLWLPAIAGLVLALIYAWLAGFSITTQRAFVMCLVVTFFELLHLNYSRWFKLLFTLTVLLLFDPMASMSASFWLSFNAVAILMLFSSLPWLNRFMGLKKLLAIQFLLIASMIPISLIIFGGFSYLAPVSNLLCVPYFSFVVIPLVFIGLILSLLTPVLAELVWRFVDILLEPVMRGITFIDSGWMIFAGRYVPVVVAVLLGWMSGSLIRFRYKVVIVSIVLSGLVFNLKPREWHLDVLDVGQGLSLLIQSQDKALLYDTGNKWINGSIAESIVSPILHKKGIMQLDALILSHMDSDHAGGKEWIEMYFQPERKWASQRMPDYLPCIAGQKWDWQGLTFEAVWPPRLVERAYNPHSCVIRISDGYTRLLLTGDIEKISEYILLKSGTDIKAEIMLVPHHGSLTSSTGAFLDKVSPKLAIASLAKGNQWKMPSPEVQKRYAQREVRWLDTGESGQISITFSQNGYKISKMREAGSIPWYRQMLRKGVE